MVSEYQNSKSEQNFFKNLLPLAKQLDTLRRTREFKIEFENEKSNFPPKNHENQDFLSNISEKNEPDNQNEDLVMQVHDDKDYDIEEIKFWNFVSKNKGIKPNVIRTVVYKVPESSYIVKKIPIVVEDIEVPEQKEKEDSSTIESNSITQTDEKLDENIPNPLIKSEQNNQPKLITSSRKDINELKISQPLKFDSEDIILIDEDDDIIGFEEENQNEEEKNSIMKNEHINNYKVQPDDEDDDIIEENFIEKKESIIKQEITGKDDKLSLLERSFNIQKKPRRGRPAGRPKVVTEKADEPASTIRVKKSLDQSSKAGVKSKHLVNNLDKSLPIISYSRPVNTRKSLNLKKQDVSETLDQISSSSSNLSTV